MFKIIVRIRKKKISVGKAQKRINLATCVKDNKKYFINTLMAIGGTRRTSIPYGGGDVVTKEEEKAELFNPFFASVFNNKTGCPQDKCSPELVDKDREQNRPL